MTKITIIPKTDQDILKLMITKEKEGKFGTFYRTGKKKKGEDKWLHTESVPFVVEGWMAAPSTIIYPTFLS